MSAAAVPDGREVWMFAIRRHSVFGAMAVALTAFVLPLRSSAQTTEADGTTVSARAAILAPAGSPDTSRTPQATADLSDALQRMPREFAPATFTLVPAGIAYRDSTVAYRDSKAAD